MSNSRVPYIMLVVMAALLLTLTACEGLAGGEPMVVGSVDNGSSGDTVAQAAPQENPHGDTSLLRLGADTYSINCAVCHAPNGSGTASGPSFANLAALSDDDVRALIASGRGNMPPFTALSEAEVTAVIEYIRLLSQAHSAGPGAAMSAGAGTGGMGGSDAGSGGGGTTEEIAPTEVTGSVRGTVNLNGGELPAGLVAQLHIVDREFNEQTIEQPVAADGSYLFENVTFREDRGFVVTVDHGSGFFASEMIFGRIDDPNPVLDVTMYGRTDDASALEINALSTQLDMTIDGLHVIQLYTFSSTSDAMYIVDNAAGEGVAGSVRIALPEGASALPNRSEPDRYVIADDGSAIIDTRPVLPNEPHLVYVAYLLPTTDGYNFTQPVDYRINGPVEIYGRSDQIALQPEGDLFSGSLPAREFNGLTYSGFGSAITLDAGSALPFNAAVLSVPAVPQAAAPQTPLNQILGPILVGAGVLMILGAIVMYLRSRGQGLPVAPVLGSDPQARIHTLMQQIAELDRLQQEGKITGARYDRERNRLKAELMGLMKTQQANP